MKKIYLTLLLAVSVFVFNFQPAVAKSEKDPSKKEQKLEQQNVKQNPEIAKIDNFLKIFLQFSNEHNMQGLKQLYTRDYISGDGIKKEDLFSLIEKTWKAYPDISYNSTVKSIRITDNSASVETIDFIRATTAEPSELTNDIGFLVSESHNIIYLKRAGSDWKIDSDRVIYEKTLLKYGSSKRVDMGFSVPEQVFAGSDYTASLFVKIPDGMVCLASITRDPIVYPEVETQEIFRQVPRDFGVLERVMKSNTTNNNELAVASVGLTEFIENEARLTGVALLMQRVNVVPRSTFDVSAHKEVHCQLDELMEDE